jgi:hypothetical protein
VRGAIFREALVANAPASAEATAGADVAVRSNPGIAHPNDGILNERAIRSPSSPFSDQPDFDKAVPIRLVSCQIYLVDLTAGCRINPAASSALGAAYRSSCSAMADAVFSLDQATFDQQFGASSFSLSAHYSIQYSPGIAQPVPDPGAAAMMLLGLAGWAVYPQAARLMRFRCRAACPMHLSLIRAHDGHPDRQDHRRAGSRCGFRPAGSTLHALRCTKGVAPLPGTSTVVLSASSTSARVPAAAMPSPQPG